MLKLRIPKRHSSRQRPPRDHSKNPNYLVAKLAKLEREHASIGPLLFGIKYHQEIMDCPDTPATLAKLAGVGDSYGTDISKGMRLAAHVVVRGCTK